MEIGSRIIIKFNNGLYITETVCWAVIVAIALAITLPLLARKLQKIPKGAQGVAELIVEFTYNLVGNNMGKKNLVFAPFIGSMLIYLVVSNALGLIGVRAVTADMNATFAMGILVFLVIQGTSIKSKGIKGYFIHFFKPYPFLIITNVMEEITFVISVSFRLFGNILAGVIIIELLMEFLGWLSTSVLPLPIPLLEIGVPLPLNFFFDMFEAGLQAFVFMTLSMAFISKASHRLGEE